jgi:hypothetical protein
METPRHDVKETFGEFEGASSGVQEALPGLGLRLHALCYHLGGVLSRDHCCKPKIEDVGNVIDEAVAGTLVGEGLGGVAELCALAHFIHGLEHQATNQDPKCRANAATLARTMGGVERGGRVAPRGNTVSRFDKIVSV